MKSVSSIFFLEFREWFSNTCDRFSGNCRTEFCKIWSHERKFSGFLRCCWCSSVSSLAHATSRRISCRVDSIRSSSLRYLRSSAGLYRLSLFSLSAVWLRPSCIGGAGSGKSKSGNRLNARKRDGNPVQRKEKYILIRVFLSFTVSSLFDSVQICRLAQARSCITWAPFGCTASIHQRYTIYLPCFCYFFTIASIQVHDSSRRRWWRAEPNRLNSSRIVNILFSFCYRSIRDAVPMVRPSFLVSGSIFGFIRMIFIPNCLSIIKFCSFWQSKLVVHDVSRYDRIYQKRFSWIFWGEAVNGNRWVVNLIPSTVSISEVESTINFLEK